MRPPHPYAFLADEGAPRMLVEGLKTFGVKEKLGPAANPVIMGWWDELRLAGLTRVYGDGFFKDDAIPWCGLWMAHVARRAGKPVPRLFMAAREWGSWGNPVVGPPKLGDTLVFTRQGGGHVGLYAGEDESAFHVLGGNQSDSVCVTRILKTRLLVARNLYNIGQPPNCRRIFFAADGTLSQNEA